MDKDNHVPVPSNAPKADIQSAIRMPDFLFSDDGRRFDIREWHPHVRVGDVVSVSLEAIVRLPRK